MISCPSVPFIGRLGGIATPGVRAMMSGIVDPNEQGGKYLAFLVDLTKFNQPSMRVGNWYFFPFFDW